MLLLILPLDQMGKIEAPEIKGVEITSDTIIITFRNMNTKGYMSAGEPENYKIGFNELKFKQRMEIGCSLIYNNQESKIYRSTKN